MKSLFLIASIFLFADVLSAQDTLTKDDILRRIFNVCTKRKCMRHSREEVPGFQYVSYHQNLKEPMFNYLEFALFEGGIPSKSTWAIYHFYYIGDNLVYIVKAKAPKGKNNAVYFLNGGKLFSEDTKGDVGGLSQDRIYELDEKLRSSRHHFLSSVK